MLVYGHDDKIGEWVALKLGLRPFAPGLFRAIGIIEHNKLIAGVVYSNQHMDIRGNPLLIEMTIASVDKSWCTRHNLNQLFAYPFIQLNVKRVQATCSRKAKHVRGFLERLGFRFEGIVREAWPHGGDAAHFSMLKPECKWIAIEQRFPVPPSSARSSKNFSSANAIQ